MSGNATADEGKFTGFEEPATELEITRVEEGNVASREANTEGAEVLSFFRLEDTMAVAVPEEGLANASSPRSRNPKSARLPEEDSCPLSAP